VRVTEEEYWSARRTAFGSGAADYAVGRPRYPLEAIRWVLPEGAVRVLDLAAGTGRITERLLELGLDVSAVEPLPEMRAHIPAAAAAVDGKAEAIPFDDASFDAVLVGQAFHWFDAEAAIAEMARVLRPGGRIGLMWNLLDDADPWVDEFLTLFGGDERASSIPETRQPPYRDGSPLSPAEARLFRHTDSYDGDRLLQYVASRSQMILMPDDERAALLDRVADHARGRTIELPLVCEVWRAERQA
jgi:SAM-dependent methyltransferase